MNRTMKPRAMKKAPKITATVAAPVDGQLHLTQEHMHKLFHLGGTVDRFSAQLGALEKDDVNDELNLKLQAETLQRLQSEFTLRRQRRLADRQQLLGLQGQALREYVLYRDELGALYNVDLSTASFDDKTGLIQFPPAAVDVPPSDPTPPAP